MPDVDPAIYDAIDQVVENRKVDADWDADSMRSALMDVAKGENQSDAAEGRSFSQPLLSQRWSDVQETAQHIQETREGGSNLFRDPLEEAIEDFEQFFDELNDKYDLGIRNRAVQMMVDEIRDGQRLPLPMYLEKFLRGTKSGVQGTDVDYIRRRYETWLEKHDPQPNQQEGPAGGMGGMGGQRVSQNQQQDVGMQGGIPIGGGGVPNQGQYGAQRGQPNQYQGQQPQQQQPGPPQQQPHGAQPQMEDPRVDELQEQVEALNHAIGELVEEDQGGEDMVEVETGDGVKATMPLDQAIAMGYLGEDDDGFMDKLQAAQDAGVIPSPADAEDDGRDLMETIQLLKEMGVVDDGSDDDMANAIGEAIQTLGEKQMQAQQQMSQNFSHVLEEMKDMQEDEDEDLSSEDVAQIVEDKLTKSETDRLREEVNEKFNRVMNEVQETKRRDVPAEQDTEYLKTDRKMEYQERQLDTLNQNLRELPDAVSNSVQDGLLPILKEMKFMQSESDGDLWAPPEGDNRSQPDYTPAETAGNQRQQPPQRAQQEQTQPQQQAGYPEASQRQQPEGAAQEPEPEPEIEPGVDRERAREIREKLPIGGDDEQQEAKA